MKKNLLTLLISILMVFTLVGCNFKEETPVIDKSEQQEAVEPKEDEPITDGFVEVEDKTLTDELREIFNKALEGYTGMSLEPIEIYQTQVVAGTNYKFVCSGTKTTNPPISGSYFVTVYKDLQGNCSIIDVETITESTGDVDGDPTVKEVDKTINYWVVFYNPDSSEIQRSAIKYGTIPTFDGDTPQYWDEDYWYKFVCWTDKQGNEINEFKPITGNTYIYAKYEIGGVNKPIVKEEPAPTPSNATVIFNIGGSGFGYMEENVTGSQYPDGTQMSFAIGTSFSINGDELTINGVTYVPHETHGEMFEHWECNGAIVASGQIEGDTAFDAKFGPPA